MNHPCAVLVYASLHAMLTSLPAPKAERSFMADYKLFTNREKHAGDRVLTAIKTEYFIFTALSFTNLDKSPI